MLPLIACAELIGISSIVSYLTDHNGVFVS
jgi:hypothetical protein